MYRNFYVEVGPFIFSISSNITTIHRYLETYYKHCLIEHLKEEQFVDYHVEVIKGNWCRRLLKPQAIFKFNYHTPFKPLPLNQACALLEWGMNWVIANQAHQFFMLHAATVSRDGQGVIIAAPSGSGKSTLCAYLISQGWKLLSDELALLDPHTMLLHGLGRPISLKNDSIDLIRKYYREEQFSNVIKDTQKGTICLLKTNPSDIINSNTLVQPSHIIFVKYSPDENCYSEMIDPALALTEIIRNSFNFNILNKRGFDYARKLVINTQVHYIEYSNFQSCEHTIIKLLERKQENTLSYA